MKKGLYLIPVLLMSSMSCFAYVDSNHMTSDQFLINTGYSKATVTAVESMKLSPYGSPVPKRDQRNFLVRFYHYIAPLSEGDRSFPTHDIKFNSNWQDL